MPRRRVIALLTNNVGMRSDYQGLLRHGIERACVELDIDLWVYAGRSDWRDCGLSHSHIYGLVCPTRIDGIIVAAGCIGAVLSVEEVLHLVRQRCPVPTCAVGQRCATVPSVVVDNGTGAAKLAHHFVKRHHCRRFAYIAGPTGHEESEERLRATRAALTEVAVALPAGAIVHGNFSPGSGSEAARELLRNGVAFDALIAANDDMAVGALEALEAAGLRCPKDVKVAGFDDSPSSRTSDPALTTVRQPIVDLGAAAVARVVSAWQGNTTTDLITLETEPVLRESCGCSREGATRVRSGELTDSLPPETLTRRVAESLAPLLQDRAQRERWAGTLCAAVDAERGGKADALRRGLQALLEEVALTDAPIHELQQVILCLRDGLLEGEVSPELEAVFRRALVQVGQTMHRLEGKRRLHDEDLTERLRANWERLSASSLDLPALRSALTMQMPWLSILNGFVGMYVRDNPNLLVTLACVTDGQPVALDEQPYPAQKLLPDKVLITPNRRSLAVFPLTFEWQELGVAVLELPQNHELYAMLREQIGSAVKTVQLHEDILKQARLSAQAEEEKRVTAERLRSLGLVAGGVAHDLNNVLGPLVGLPEAISHDLLRAVGEGVPRKVFEDLDIIRLAGLRAADTIQDLLTLGQQKPAPKVALDLNLLLANEWRAITALAESNPQVVVRVKTGDTPLIVHASKPHLMRAISNLVINAADAIRGPGTITVRAAARVLTEPRSGIESIDPGQYAVVEVEDTGAGIPPENLARILEPFFTTKQSNERRGGTGLGLAIVHRIANDSLGYVEVESQLGQGSKFSLYFPLQQEEDVHSSSRPAPATRGSERILVIDDEPVQLRTARRILEQLGYSVTTARSGEAGLALLNEALSIREFELVVLDMMMPGLDGLETLKRIRTVRPGQKALIVTGFTPQQSNRTSEDPPHLWLPKPYTPDALGRAVRHALDG